MWTNLWTLWGCAVLCRGPGLIWCRLCNWLKENHLIPLDFRRRGMDDPQDFFQQWQLSLWHQKEKQTWREHVAREKQEIWGLPQYGKPRRTKVRQRKKEAKMTTCIPIKWPQVWQNSRDVSKVESRLVSSRSLTFWWQQSTACTFHARVLQHAAERWPSWDSHPLGLAQRGSSHEACWSGLCSPRS